MANLDIFDGLVIFKFVCVSASVHMCVLMCTYMCMDACACVLAL